MTRFSVLFPRRKQDNSPIYVYAYSISSISQMTLRVKESMSTHPVDTKEQVPCTPSPILDHNK